MYKVQKTSKQTSERETKRTKKVLTKKREKTKKKFTIDLSIDVHNIKPARMFF